MAILGVLGKRVKIGRFLRLSYHRGIAEGSEVQALMYGWARTIAPWLSVVVGSRVEGRAVLIEELLDRLWAFPGIA